MVYGYKIYSDRLRLCVDLSHMTFYRLACDILTQMFAEFNPLESVNLTDSGSGFSLLKTPLKDVDG